VVAATNKDPKDGNRKKVGKGFGRICNKPQAGSDIDKRGYPQLNDRREDISVTHKAFFSPFLRENCFRTWKRT